MPLVSIIVPCYNHAQYLPETLDSVIAQTYKEWECVVVNDGSNDDTENIAKSYCEKDIRFKYIYQENRGASAARNNGIKSSHGKYILPLDADDLIEPTYIEKTIYYHETHPDTKIVYTKADRFGAEKSSLIVPEYNYENLIWKNSIFVTAMYKRSDYENTSGYDERMKLGLEDWDFWLSLLKKGDTVHIIDEVLFHYRYGSNYNSPNAKKNNEQLLRVIYNNHKDIYSKYCEDIIILKRNVMSREETIDLYKNSSSYKVGHFLLSPIIYLKSLLRHKE